MRRIVRALLVPTLALAPTASCGTCGDAPQHARAPRSATAGVASSSAHAALRHGLSEQQAAQVLVDLGTRKVTLGDFAARLAEQSPAVIARYDTPERRREFLDGMIDFDLLADEAERRGHATHPSVELAGSHAMVQRMMYDQFVAQGPKLSDLTPAEIAQQERALEGEPVERGEHLIRNRAWRAKQQAAVASFVGTLRQQAHVQVDFDPRTASWLAEAPQPR